MHGDTTPSQAILSHLIQTEQRVVGLVVVAAFGVQPWRPPSEMLHCAVQLFALVRPAHWCGPHIPTNCHELMDKCADLLLVVDHLL